MVDKMAWIILLLSALTVWTKIGSGQETTIPSLSHDRSNDTQPEQLQLQQGQQQEQQQGLGQQQGQQPIESPVVTFLQEPDEVYYIVKSKPATITCKALNANQIIFKCVGQWIQPTQHVNMESVDPSTQQKILQTSIDVMKVDVEEYVGPEGYWCECYAWNNMIVPRSYKSGRGIVQVAYLRKQFEREPLSTSAELESTVQLQCLPPIGLPLAEVFWLKGSDVIDTSKDINFIVSNEGNLIISQARLSDMANYTCGAQNVASRRLSEVAFLTVYVNGGWSSWNEWSPCNVNCGKGYQKRVRSCNNPPPLNGGSTCQGDPVQRLPCTNTCTVDGYWSTWSSWSTCSPDCKQHRRRLCDSPAPEHGGSYCEGSDLNTSNCTSGLCSIGSLEASEDRSAEDSALIERTDRPEQIALYAGLSVAIVVFIIAVVVIMVIIMRKRKSWPSGSSPCKKHPQDEHEVKVQPDITRTVVSDPSLCEKLLLASSEMESTPARYPDPVSTSSKPVSFGSLPPSTMPKKSVAGYLLRQGSAECLTQQQEQPDGAPAESDDKLRSLCHLPANVDADTVAWATVTHAGGRIHLPHSDVSITIPEGAVPRGFTEHMFLAVLRDDKDRPKLAETQTMLGPVVLCGPPNLKLRKPVILSFQHCASLKNGQWILSVYSCDTPSSEPPHWQPLSTLGQETVNTQVYVQVDLSNCHIMTDSLMRYTLIGEPNMAGRAIKILRVAAFMPAIPSAMDYSLRVYIVEDTKDAMEGVMQLEKKLGCCLVEKPKQILFQFGGANLFLAIEELAPGWNCKLPANFQEIPFWHIWSGTQNGLHCSFALEHLDRSRDTLTCDIHVFQKAFMANRQVIQISYNLTENALSSMSPHHSMNPTDPTSGMLNDSQPVFRLPVHIKNELCALLDPPNMRGNDWRLLAQRLNVDRYINYFATKTSPTEHILDLWEARHREETAVTDLLNCFRMMGRTDAAAAIENKLGVAWL